jgi:hypothetical protein
MKNTIAIVGSGQLGSRHLQALSKSDYNIFVVDSSEESLAIAKSRFDEVNSGFNGNINYQTQISELPEQIDVCIVATSSKVRARVIESLLENSRVTYLVLEKVLFTTLPEYDTIGTLLEATGTKAWVNCPRRLYPVYNRIREELQGERIQMQLTGNNWGLGCNGIHILDLFAFLTRNSNIKLSSEHLDPIIHESKRPGYIEFTGTLLGSTNKGDTVSITSNQAESLSPMLFTITSPNIHYVIQQSNVMDISTARAANNWKWEKSEEALPFQSVLTGNLVKDLLKTGSCGLTAYAESVELHKAFLKSLMAFTGKIENKNIESCPIT